MPSSDKFYLLFSHFFQICSLGGADVCFGALFCKQIRPKTKTYLVSRRYKRCINRLMQHHVTFFCIIDGASIVFKALFCSIFGTFFPQFFPNFLLNFFHNFFGNSQYFKDYFSHFDLQLTKYEKHLFKPSLSTVRKACSV